MVGVDGGGCGGVECDRERVEGAVVDGENRGRGGRK